MIDFKALKNKLEEICNSEADFTFECEMKNYTTFHIGGKASLAVFPHTRKALCDIAEYLSVNNIKYVVIGNGSNVLFADEGYNGVVLFTVKLKSFYFDENTLFADAGASVTLMAQTAVKKGYDGFAFACGIPGSVGGAVYMNAGAYGGEISDILLYSEYFDTISRKTVRLDNKSHDFGYRHSFYSNKNHVILGAAFSLVKAEDPAQQRALMEEHLKSRAAKQPLQYPSAGSVFKRYPGYYTAQLIDRAGLKGFCVGGAQVSQKHAGFIINRGNATCADVLELIDIIKKKIYDMEGINIECEVRYID